MSNVIVRYIICAIISVPLYFLVMFIKKQSKGVRIIAVSIIMAVMMTTVTVYAVSQMTDSERAHYKTELAQKLPHYKYYDTPEQCLEEDGFGSATLVYKIEGEGTMDALYLSAHGTTYKVNFKTKDSKGATRYCIDKVKIDKAESVCNATSSSKWLSDDIDYIWVSINKSVENMNFDGYVPEIINANATVDGIDKTYHFYIFDKTKEPDSEYNYAPFCGLLNDSNDAYKAIEICDIIMNMDLNTDVNTFADEIGAADVKQLPASIADTYEYQLDNGFRIRSHGLPFESFVFSTEYGSVTIKTSDKSITPKY